MTFRLKPKLKKNQRLRGKKEITAIHISNQDKFKRGHFQLLYYPLLKKKKSIFSIEIIKIILLCILKLIFNVPTKQA